MTSHNPKLLLLAAVFVSAPALANPFNGLNLSGAVSVEATAGISENTNDAGKTTGAGGSPGYSPAVGFDFGVEVSPDVSLFFGADYAFGSYNTSTNEDVDADTKIEIDAAPTYSVYAGPAFSLNDSTAIYGKLSYSSMDFTLKVENLTTGVSAVDESETLTGIGYGAGIRTMLSDEMFVDFGVHRTTYDSKENTVLEAKLGADRLQSTIAIGIKF